jgi:hypothetical protein
VTLIDGFNIIAHNGRSGVAVDSGRRVAIRSNIIFANGGLGIDLGPAGVTPNDPGDADAGANDLQNFPFITSVVTAGERTTISGTLSSTPDSSFFVQLFSNTAADPSGYGEGAALLPGIPVTTDASGNGAFSLALNPLPEGTAITATATATPAFPDYPWTSEFSPAAFVVIPRATSADFDFRHAAHALRFTFSGNVGATLGLADVEVYNLNTGPVTVAGVSYDNAANTATFTFNPAALPNGNYVAILRSAGVTDAAGNALAADFTVQFFVLTGDINRDRAVNGSDFAILAGNFGKSGTTYAQGDLNGDGTVNGSDFALLAGNFGRTVPAPPAATTAAKSPLAAPAAAAATPAPQSRVVRRPTRLTTRPTSRLKASAARGTGLTQ